MNNRNNNTNNNRIIVIEGIGGILSNNFITPILLDFKKELINNPNIKFYGTDLKSKLTEKGLQSIKALTDIGMIFIDKDSPAGIKLYDSIQPDYVYIATPPHTHIPLSYGWLQRKVTPKIILVEKPFTENLQEMQQFVTFINNNPNLATKVYAFDHANAFELSGHRLQEIKNYLGSITNMIFFWVHDLSGADKNQPIMTKEGDNRPITRINRFNFLADEQRQVFDALIHFLIPVAEIVDVDSTKILQVKAAQYENAEIKGETFVAAKLLMNSKNSKNSDNKNDNKIGDSSEINKLSAKKAKTAKSDKLISDSDTQNSVTPISVTLYAGSGIGKIESLGLNMAHMLILRNNYSGKEVRINLDTATMEFINSKIDINTHIDLKSNGNSNDNGNGHGNGHGNGNNISRGGDSSNEGTVDAKYSIHKIYKKEMHNLFFGDPQMGQTPQYALKCLDVLDQIRSQINYQQQHFGLSTYTLGTSTKAAPSLEQVLKQTKSYSIETSSTQNI